MPMTLERFTDWSPRTVDSVRAGDLAPPLYTPVGTELPGGLADGSVVYEDNTVTAYFDVGGRAVPQALASWCKVWTRVGAETRLKIVSLSAERPTLSASATVPEGA